MKQKSKLKTLNRLHIRKDSDKEISIEITPLKDEISKSQLRFLIFGLCGLLIAFSQIFSNEKPLAKLFLLAWSILWIIFLMKIWNVLKWRRFGKEFIRISGEQLFIEIRCPFIYHRDSYNIQDSRILKYKHQILATEKFFKVNAGVLKIENKTKSSLIGKYLNDSETNKLAEELRSVGLKCEFEINGIDRIQNINNVDKSSKNHKNRIRRNAFLICLIPAFMFGYSNYKENTYKYLLLKSTGKITRVTSEYHENWDTDYYYYYFVASNGQKVESRGKCGDKDRFENYYKNLKVIYNPSNPEQYMEYPNYAEYSIFKYIFFSLIFTTLILAGVGSSVISFIYLGTKSSKKNTPLKRGHKSLHEK